MRRLLLAASACYCFAGGCLCSDIPNLSANLDAGQSTGTGATGTAGSTTGGVSTGSTRGGGTGTAGSTTRGSGASGTSTGGVATSGASGESTTGGSTGATGTGSSGGGTSGRLPTWTACRSPQPFVIDADASAWTGIPSFFIPYTDAIIAPTSPIAPTSNAELSATVQAAWDTANLYVFVQITDPVVVDYPDAIYLSEVDSVELYVDGTNFRLPDYDAGDYQMTISAYDQAVLFGDPNLFDAGLYEYAAELTGAGYDVEYGVPWTLIIGNDGGVIGFDVAVNGNDGGGLWRETQLMWSGDGGAYLDPRQFGQLYLSNALCGSDGG